MKPSKFQFLNPHLDEINYSINNNTEFIQDTPIKMRNEFSVKVDRFKEKKSWTLDNHMC